MRVPLMFTLCVDGGLAGKAEEAPMLEAPGTRALPLLRPRKSASVAAVASRGRVDPKDVTLDAAVGWAYILARRSCAVSVAPGPSVTSTTEPPTPKKPSPADVTGLGTSCSLAWRILFHALCGKIDTVGAVRGRGVRSYSGTFGRPRPSASRDGRDGRAIPVSGAGCGGRTGVGGRTVVAGVIVISGLSMPHQIPCTYPGGSPGKAECTGQSSR